MQGNLSRLLENHCSVRALTSALPPVSRGLKAPASRGFCAGVDRASMKIGNQITVMNLEFAGFEGGFNTGFSFRLAGITRTDNGAWFNAGIGGLGNAARSAFRLA